MLNKMIKRYSINDDSDTQNQDEQLMNELMRFLPKKKKKKLTQKTDKASQKHSGKPF